MLERSPSTVDQVIEAIKLGIRDARYVPAQRLIEPDLAKEYGVSRGSVREALRRLAAEGFVNLERFRGASIIRMSRKQVVDLLELREVLEGFGASLAARRSDNNGRLKLTRLEKIAQCEVGAAPPIRRLQQRISRPDPGPERKRRVAGYVEPHQASDLSASVQPHPAAAGANQAVACQITTPLSRHC